MKRSRHTAEGRFRLSPDHRAAISETFLSDMNVEASTWQELEEILIGYQNMRARRSQFSLQQERRRWHRLSAHAAKLTNQLWSFPAGTVAR